MTEPESTQVDVVVAVHDTRRRVDRAVASAFGADDLGVRVTVVAHELPAGEVRSALGSLADDPRVRVLEHRDGRRSPAGPFNHGLAAADATFVAILGSDDFLDPGALDRWVEHASRTGADYVVAPLRNQDGAVWRDPVTRAGRVGPLDLVRDRLAYRTAPLGLVRRSFLDAVDVPLTDGLRTGEDVELGLALLAGGGRVDFDPALPAYVIGADAPERVTLEARPAAEELEAVRRLAASAWLAELPAPARGAVAVKIARMHLVPAVRRRPEPAVWTPADLEALGEVADWVLRYGGRGVGQLSRADGTTVRASSSRDAAVVTRAAAVGRPWERLLTTTPTMLLAPDSPVRRELAVRTAGVRGRPPGAAVRATLGRVAAAPNALVARTLRSRNSLPTWVNRAIDHVADHPDGLLGRVAALSLGPITDVPPPTSVPQAPVRVYVGPTNYAEQGYAWARSLEAARPGVGARNMSVAVPGGFGFRTDTEVPVAVYNRSRAWQEAELGAVREFTHVLVEAERPIFGRLFSRDVAREERVLAGAGISTAYMCHGTDIRLPSRHVARTRWSPYLDPDMYVARHEREAARNAELLERLGRPVLVSTPDLLADVPYARWCPVVVDSARWSAPRRPERRVPVVAHVPSNAGIKGTELVRPAMQRLHERGVIEYREITGVPSEKMPAVWADADVVLDQFRLGSYGVAACEAMAAGCVVVGHVLDDVRAHVLSASGSALPVVEADPDDVEAVVTALAADPDRRAAIAAEGAAFVRDVHDGRLSARVLLEHWVDVADRG